MQLVEYSLARAGAEYLRYLTANGGALGRRLSSRVPWASGAVATALLPGAPVDVIDDLDHLKQGGLVSFRPSPESLESTDSPFAWLVGIVASRLSSRSGFLLVEEELDRGPGSEAAANGASVSCLDGTTMLSLSAPAGRSAVVSVLISADNAWMMVGAVGSAPPDVNVGDSAGLEGFVSTVDLVFGTAYDGDGYVVWRR